MSSPLTFCQPKGSTWLVLAQAQAGVAKISALLCAIRTLQAKPQMPLDTSSYSLALLRLDGRRWNELRRINAQISTQAAADGSSYLEMGNTKVICTVSGPAEGRRIGGGGVAGSEATIQVEISIAGFSGVERKRRTRGDKSVKYMRTHVGIYPNSIIL
jgi:exosome complex component RRP41